MLEPPPPKGADLAEGIALDQDQRIDLRTGTRVTDIDARTRKLVLSGGETLPFAALLLATGAQPRSPAEARVVPAQG